MHPFQPSFRIDVGIITFFSYEKETRECGFVEIVNALGQHADIFHLWNKEMEWGNVNQPALSCTLQSTIYPRNYILSWATENQEYGTLNAEKNIVCKQINYMRSIPILWNSRQILKWT